MKEYRGGVTLLIVGVLALWAIATAAILATIGVRDAELLEWALAGAVVVVPLARPFRGADILIAVLAVAGLFGAQVYRTMGVTGILDGLSMVLVLPGALSLLVAWVLSRLAAQLIRREEERSQRDAKVIDSLSNVDELTGVLKELYGDRVMSQEIERARRYERPLSILLLGAEDWPAIVRARGREQTNDALAAAGRAVKEKLRAIDSVSRLGEAQFVAVLPETSSAGAQIAAGRICEAIVNSAAIEFRAGVAEFPADGVSKEELLKEADAALRFAHSTGTSVVSRDLLA